MADAVEMMLLAILGPALTCTWPEITEMQIASLTTVSELFLVHRDAFRTASRASSLA